MRMLMAEDHTTESRISRAKSGDREAFDNVRSNLKTDQVAALFRQPADALKRFDIEDLNVIKISLPRPTVQGSRFDRDMHGAQWAVLLSEMELCA